MGMEQFIAQKHIKKEKKLLLNMKRALWDANAALSLQPTFMDAINLREQILQKELSEPAGSAIKDLVLRRIGGDDVHRRGGEVAAPGTKTPADNLPAAPSEQEDGQ